MIFGLAKPVLLKGGSGAMSANSSRRQASETSKKVHRRQLEAKTLPAKMALNTIATGIDGKANKRCYNEDGSNNSKFKQILYKLYIHINDIYIYIYLQEGKGLGSGPSQAKHNSRQNVA